MNLFMIFQTHQYFMYKLLLILSANVIFEGILNAASAGISSDFKSEREQRSDKLQLGAIYLF